MLQNPAMRQIAVLIFLLLLPAKIFAESSPSPQELEQEIARYKALLKTDNNNARYLNAIGFAYYRLNRIDDAMSFYQRAAEADPGYALAFNNIGAVYMQHKEYEKAEAAFRKALSLDPNNAKAAYNLAAALYRQGRYAEAYKVYGLAKSIDASYVKKRLNGSTARSEIEEQIKNHPDSEISKELKKDLEAAK